MRRKPTTAAETDKKVLAFAAREVAINQYLQACAKTARGWLPAYMADGKPHPKKQITHDAMGLLIAKKRVDLKKLVMFVLVKRYLDFALGVELGQKKDRDTGVSLYLSVENGWRLTRKATAAECEEHALLLEDRKKGATEECKLWERYYEHRFGRPLNLREVRMRRNGWGGVVAA